MRYSDRQRVQKIYDYAIRLQAYLRKNNIGKEELPVLIKQLELCLAEDEGSMKNVTE